MAAHLQQHDVIEFVLAGTACVPQVAQFHGITLIREKTAATGRLRIVGKPVVCSQRHLWFAAATGKSMHPVTSYPAFTLGQGGWKVLRTQRSQQTILDSRLMLHDRHGLLALRFRALTDHLSGDHEVEAPLLYPFARLAHHEDLAIEAGVHVGTVAVPGVEHDVLVLVDNIHDMQLDAELFRDP